MTSVKTNILVRDGEITVHTYQDVEDIIEANKRLQSVSQKSDWGRHVARVPCNILNQWLDEEYAKGNVNLRWGSEEFDRLVAKKLSDHDWLFLRTDL